MLVPLLHRIRRIRRSRRSRRRSGIVAAFAAVCLGALAAATAAEGRSAPQAGGAARASASAPAGKHLRSKLSLGDSRDTVDVKFAEGSDVRLRGGHLVSLGGGHIGALDDVLARFPGLGITRLFVSGSEDELAASRDQARARSGRAQLDLNLYFRLRTAPGADVVALLDALNALEIVEVAAPEAEPVPAPTPSFVSGQGYRSAAYSGGIDADYAQTLSGGKGDNVTIVDVEYGWNRSHEDLAKARLAGSALENGTPCDPFAAEKGVHSTDHGTAVLGELVGDANAFGVTGVAPGASLRTVNASRVDAAGACSYDLANAIKVATDNTSAGDVILIEQQLGGPRWTNPKSDFGYVPVEWEQTGTVWAAIQNATSLGRIVIEPAGNGYQDLDDPVYNNSAGRNWFSYDSGAIVVGAGNAPGCTWGTDPTVARGRLSFSNYGSRLDVQGWGDCVTTTGYHLDSDALQGGPDSNLWYTKGFSGTSSASPIVAGAAALLASVAESRGTTLTPATARSLLASTGQPQAFGNSGKIGPLPNVKAAIDALGPKLTEADHAIVEGSNLGATTVPVRETWSSSGAAAQYEVWRSTDGGNYVKQTLASPNSASAVFLLERNHNYRFAARAADAAGIWGDWAYGATFDLGEYQENYSAGNPAYTGGWTRAAWQPASDGYLDVSAAAGDRATFSFTGSNVAWVATKATNRGQADVYVDGVFAKTVDLYAPSTSAQSIAYSRSWPQSSSHTIEVRVRATAGRPSVDVDAFVRLR